MTVSSMSARACYVRTGLLVAAALQRLRIMPLRDHEGWSGSTMPSIKKHQLRRASSRMLFNADDAAPSASPRHVMRNPGFAERVEEKLSNGCPLLRAGVRGAGGHVEQTVALDGSCEVGADRRQDAARAFQGPRTPA